MNLKAIRELLLDVWEPVSGGVGAQARLVGSQPPLNLTRWVACAVAV